MDIWNYRAEKHIGVGGVTSIEIHEIVDGESGPLVFSIDENGNMELSQAIYEEVHSVDAHETS